jgi:hypothetical protein
MNDLFEFLDMYVEGEKAINAPQKKDKESRGETLSDPADIARF